MKLFNFVQIIRKYTVLTGVFYNVPVYTEVYWLGPTVWYEVLGDH